MKTLVQIHIPSKWVNNKIKHLRVEIETSPNDVKLACGRSHILQTFTLTSPFTYLAGNGPANEPPPISTNADDWFDRVNYYICIFPVNYFVK